MRIHLCGLLMLIMTACASNSGVAPAGRDTYLVSRQAATGFTGLGTLKADALREADAFCNRLGKAMKVNRTSESSPPYVLGNFPKADVEFMCLSRDDPRLK